MKIAKIELQFKLQDFWIGIFWKSGFNWPIGDFKLIDIWICLIPCFPLHIRLHNKKIRIGDTTYKVDYRE